MTLATSVPTHAYRTAPRSATHTLRLGMLGLGRVGSAVASLLCEQPAIGRRFTIAGALVRTLGRTREPAAANVRLTTDATALLTDGVDVVIEALGGLEPAKSLVLAALERGRAVVTANKSLLAAHGDELLEAAVASGAPFRYEASVIAGVPFLGMLARRPLAGEVTALAGIVNGTSNYLLSRMASERATFDAALAEARALGYAEPNPASDVLGIDAAEKLCVLLRHFGAWSVRPSAIETTGVDGLIPQDLEHARWFGGAIRPIVLADWQAREPTAFAGPAFVDARHPLARVDGVRNAILLHSRWSGDLVFSGPGAGPAVTAATLLDDAREAVADAMSDDPGKARPGYSCAPPETGWFIRLAAARLPDTTDLGRLAAAHGVSLRRASALDTRSGTECLWLLTHPCARVCVDRAIAALPASGCKGYAVRAVS